MYLKLIACKVLQREVASLMYRCPNTIDVTMIKQGYHETPEILRKVLQEEIDRIDGNTDPHTNDLAECRLDANFLSASFTTKLQRLRRNFMMTAYSPPPACIFCFFRIVLHLLGKYAIIMMLLFLQKPERGDRI